MIIRPRPSIILFGDSITQQGFSGSSASTSLGWVSLLSNAYTRRADLLNRGYSGYNTRHALDILPAVFGECGQDNVLMVTVFFGANDASLFRNGEHCQHVPIDEYEDNLRKIVTTIRDRLEIKTNETKETAPILLITPPPIDSSKWDECCMETFGSVSPRTNLATKAYGERVKSVANDLKCYIVDAFSLLGGDHDGGEAHYGQYLEDGLHLNESGNNVLYKGLIDVIRRELPDLAPMEDGEGKYGSRGIPLDGKLWKELC